MQFAALVGGIVLIAALAYGVNMILKWVTRASDLMDEDNTKTENKDHEQQ